MAKKARSTLSLVLLPAAISLVITILRLLGELQGWHDSLFSNVAPGGESKPGYIGISWLMPVFGFWFGFKLRRATGEPARIGKAALLSLGGAAILIGGLMACISLEWITLPNAKAPGQATGLAYSLVLVGLAAITMLIAWPRLAKTLLLYGILARIPVVIVTYFAVQNDWDCHYNKLPMGTVLLDESERFTYLAMPQVTIWIAATMIVGGLFGCLGALLGGRSGK